MKYIKYRTQRGVSITGIRKIDINDNYPSSDLYNVVVYCEMGVQIYLEGDLRGKFLSQIYNDIIDLSHEEKDIDVTQLGEYSYVQ